MANPLIPAGTTPPIPPPVPRFRIADEKGNPTPSFIEWCQLMWAAIQGKGGILDRQAIDENALLRASLSDLTERLAALENLRAPSQTADLQDRLTSLEATVIGLSLPADDNPGQSPTLGFDPSDIYAMIPPPRPADAANFSGILGVINGGTGSSTAAGALTNLGAEAQDATLDALAAYNTNGILTQTAADTFTGRTVTGTANEITATNGSGVAGNPTISLPTALTFTGKTVTGGTFASVTFSGTTTFPSSTTVDSAGKIGIGVAPTSPLDVLDASTSAGARFRWGANGDRFLVQGNTVAANGVALTVVNTAENAYAALKIEASTTDFSIGPVGIGMVPVNILDITQSQNALSQTKLLNANGGAASRTLMEVHNGTNGGGIIHHGSGFTTSGINRQDGTQVIGGGVGGLTLVAFQNQPVYIAVNNTETAQFTATRFQSTLPIAANSGTAIPAGGTAGAGVTVSSATNFGVFFGSGAPTLSAAKGSLYLRSDGTTTNDRSYINTNGSTTWTALTTAA